MYSSNGYICFENISSMNPNLGNENITFEDGSGIKYSLHIKDIIRLRECVLHECQKNDIDYLTYEAKLFGE